MSRGFIERQAGEWLGEDGRWGPYRLRVSYSLEYFERHAAPQRCVFWEASPEDCERQDLLASEITLKDGDPE